MDFDLRQFLFGSGQTRGETRRNTERQVEQEQARERQQRGVPSLESLRARMSPNDPRYASTFTNSQLREQGFTPTEISQIVTRGLTEAPYLQVMSTSPRMQAQPGAPPTRPIASDYLTNPAMGLEEEVNRQTEMINAVGRGLQLPATQAVLDTEPVRNFFVGLSRGYRPMPDDRSRAYLTSTGDPNNAAFADTFSDEELRAASFQPTEINVLREQAARQEYFRDPNSTSSQRVARLNAFREFNRRAGLEFGGASATITARAAPGYLQRASEAFDRLQPEVLPYARMTSGYRTREDTRRLQRRGYGPEVGGTHEQGRAWDLVRTDGVPWNAANVEQAIQDFEQRTGLRALRPQYVRGNQIGNPRTTNNSYVSSLGHLHLAWVLPEELQSLEGIADVNLQSPSSPNVLNRLAGVGTPDVIAETQRFRPARPR